jgi:ABC-type transporter Mla subunit MlaD
MENIKNSNNVFLKILVCIVAVTFFIQVFAVFGFVSAEKKDYELTLNFSSQWKYT